MNKKITETSPKYKLIYFDLRGRGEIPRLLFHAAKVDFIDERIDCEDKWYNSLKASKYHYFTLKIIFNSNGKSFRGCRICAGSTN